ncbi:hypothetical protein K5V21_07635 [Clostridium sardiniense]|uniref:YcxB-like protein domain-containing protein n=1 Tax=Clostridium sardiniense TaxID=29369 RepID=A0ABS7KWZ1_CLOSR|nr:hypothetical protein [Clostridium sardiniense]MBY0755326.1 hypothetical protein [Clostridium sardiniense]MDQ0459771.1 hypothetical protein [Clostridium sardiniense]
MNYKYSVDDRLYNNEINDFLKNSVALKKIRKKQMLLGAILGAILAIVLFIKSFIENKYDRDFIYIFLEYIIIYIAAISVVWIFRNIYINFIENKTLLKEYDKGYVHNLEIENKKIYYTVDDRKIELSNSILQEVSDLDNIFGIVISYKKSPKNPYAIIIIPKNIFESKESLSSFKNILEDKLKK